MADTGREVNQANADAITERYDYVYVHDPQPAGLLHYVRLRDAGGLGAKWIWRCHLDTTEALPEVWDFLRGYVELSDAAVFTMDGYVKTQREPQPAIIPPAPPPPNTQTTPFPNPHEVPQHALDRLPPTIRDSVGQRIGEPFRDGICLGVAGDDGES